MRTECWCGHWAWEQREAPRAAGLLRAEPRRQGRQRWGRAEETWSRRGVRLDWVNIQEIRMGHERERGPPEQKATAGQVAHRLRGLVEARNQRPREWPFAADFFSFL